MGEESVAGPLWSWLIQAGPVGAATWVGTVLSLIALAITIFSVAKTARRAEKEASTASRAVRHLKSTLATGSLAHTHSQIGLVVQFVHDKHFAPAQFLLAAVKRDMLLHAHDAKASDNTIADLQRRLRTVSTHIGYAQRSVEKYKAHILQNTLESIQDTIVEWESSFRIQISEATL